MHLNDIPIAATLRKLHVAAPFSHTRPQRRLSYLLRCGRLQITSEFTDSPLKLPVLLTTERYWTHYYSAEREEGEKSDVVWEIFKWVRYRLIIRCCTPELKNKCLLISADHSSGLKTPFFSFFLICFFISFLPLTVHHEEQKCILI